MTLQEHLGELRGRLIKSTLAVAVGMVGGFFAAEWVQGYFLDLVAQIAPSAEVIATTAQEKVTVYFTNALYIGIALAMPILIYQALRFLAPGLTRTEQQHAYALLPGVLLCFAGGVLFALLIAIPQMLRFLLNFGDPRIGVKPRAAEILGFCSDLALWTGLAFELPIVMFLFAMLNVTPYQFLRRGRKWAAVGLMVVAAMITPTPDALSMLIIWAPLYLLFELGLTLARFARPRAGSSAIAVFVAHWATQRSRRERQQSKLATIH
jgi:sec-independent protein translocase protein TatC